MTAITDRIIQYLQQHPEGADDDELALALGLRQRQTANIICRGLAQRGQIQRIKNPGLKIRNFALDVQPVFPELPSNQPKPRKARERSTSAPYDDPHDAWYWEGNVQSAVVRYLAGQGYDILRVCHTGSHEHGRDIEARSNQCPLWVTVKGYPRDTERTRAATQAPTHFNAALFDIICWRGEDREVELALALPDFPRYRNLAQRVSWLKSTARFHFLWVGEDGAVRPER